MDETDIDGLLAAIGNPTRRRILQKLVKETHYPLQLSRELSVSQQAIMKHLKVLEDSDLVRSVFRESGSGPPRKCYMATKRFTLVIDLSPELFSEELRIHDPEVVIEAESDSTALSQAQNLRVRLAEFMSHIAKINWQLAELSDQRDDLMSKKEHAMRYANDIIDTLCENYNERKVLRYIVAEEDLDIPEMSERLNMRETEIAKAMRKLEGKGLLMINK